MSEAVGGARARAPRIRIRAVPGSRTACVLGRHGEAWKVRVTAAPERGRANAELTRLLADVVGIPRASVEVVSGGGGRDKLVELACDLTLAEIEARLDAAATT